MNLSHGLRLTAAIVVAFHFSHVDAAGVPATKQQMQALKAAFAPKLKDAESAKFQDVLVADGIICGKMNAKNGYGGYAGPVSFRGTVHGESVEILEIDNHFGYPIAQYACHQRGLYVGELAP